MSGVQKSIAHDITNVITGSEPKEVWQSVVDKYVENPVVDISANEIAKDIFEIAIHHEISDEEATILYHSQVEEE